MKLFIRTFGCQMNVHDSLRIADIMRLHGFTLTDVPTDADVIVVNSCTVRDKASHKAISEAGRMCTYKRRNPNLVVVMVGCLAEQEGDKLLKPIPSLDLMIGPDHYGELPSLVQDVIADRLQGRAVTGFDEGKPEDFLPLSTISSSGSPSAFLTIMKGCSRHCAYCIVPSVRGKERYRDVEGIVKEAEQLIAGGAKELFLLGQTVNSYKKDGVTFAKLLSILNDLPGLERLRFTSPHPRHMTDDLIDAYSSLSTLCEAIHLPVQSGSDKILSAMKRGYTSDFVKAVAQKLRAVNSDFAISTDIIVGFPGESKSDFEDTLRLVEDVRFFGAFSFKYSPRPGTAAAAMEDDVPSDEKAERLNVLHSLINKIESEHKNNLVGKILEVLVEGQAKQPGQLTGRARNFQIVNLKQPEGCIIDDWVGRLVKVEIVRTLPHCLEGVFPGSVT